MKSQYIKIDYPSQGMMRLFLMEGLNSVYSKVRKPVDENGKPNRVLLTGMVSDAEIGASVHYLLGHYETNDTHEIMLSPELHKRLSEAAYANKEFPSDFTKKLLENALDSIQGDSELNR